MSKLVTKGFYAMVSMANADIETIFNNTNVYGVFDVNNALLSWVPGRLINNFDTLEKGKGYYVSVKDDMDLTGVFAGVEDIGNEAFPNYIIQNLASNPPPEGETGDITFSFFNTNTQQVVGAVTTISQGENLMLFQSDIPVGADGYEIKSPIDSNLSLMLILENGNFGFQSGITIPYPFSIQSYANTLLVGYQKNIFIQVQIPG